MKPYTRNDYTELAQAVNSGFPHAEANKILKMQREVGTVVEDEKFYWLTLLKRSPSNSTSMRISTGTRMRLEELKVNSRETLESVILRLLDPVEDNKD